jgi:hypothetical protein
VTVLTRVRTVVAVSTLSTDDVAVSPTTTVVVAGARPSHDEQNGSAPPSTIPTTAWRQVPEHFDVQRALASAAASERRGRNVDFMVGKGVNEWLRRCRGDVV